MRSCGRLANDQGTQMIDMLISVLHSFAMWVTFVTAVFGWSILGAGYAWYNRRPGKVVWRFGLVACILGIVVTSFALIVK